MRTLRSIFGVLCVLMWVVATNNCCLAASSSPEHEDCCDGCHSESSHDQPAPYTPEGCAPCVTLKSGINPSVLVPIVAPIPERLEDTFLSELLQTLAVLATEEISNDPPLREFPPPLWHEVVKTALPIRGPSLTA